jgi:hypothetical protein
VPDGIVPGATMSEAREVPDIESGICEFAPTRSPWIGASPSILFVRSPHGFATRSILT